MDEVFGRASYNARQSSRRKNLNCEYLSFAAREAFKKLRTNLVMGFPEEEETIGRCVGITSAKPGDGKSTIAINLAYSLAELGKKTILIDADMRRSSIHEKADIAKSPGLSHLLTGRVRTIAAAIQTYQSSESETHFDIMPAGDIPQNPSELLNSDLMTYLLRTLAANYDYVVVDLPPIGAVIDAVSVAQELSGMLVVIRENTCPKSLLADCMQQLDYAGVNVLGFVVNGALEGSGKKYQYSNYGYY